MDITNTKRATSDSVSRLATLRQRLAESPFDVRPAELAEYPPL